MKARELNKTSVSIDNIYDEIKQVNENGNFKYFIPHFIYISDAVRMQLIEDGFKVYKGDWDSAMIDCLIIEW